MKIAIIVFVLVIAIVGMIFGRKVFYKYYDLEKARKIWRLYCVWVVVIVVAFTGLALISN